MSGVGIGGGSPPCGLATQGEGGQAAVHSAAVGDASKGLLFLSVPFVQAPEVYVDRRTAGGGGGEAGLWPGILAAAGET